VGERRNKVQYLVTGEFVDPGPLLPPDQLVGMMRQAILPSHDALTNLMSEGKVIAGGYGVGERTGAFILEVDSPEELDGLLGSLPNWGMVKFKVTLLEAVERRRERDRQFTEQLEQTLQR